MNTDVFTTPFQTWIYLSGRDAGEDATYLHTPSINNAPFPLPMVGEINWDHTELLPLFSDLLPDMPIRIGESRLFDEHAEPPRVVTCFFVYSPAVGVSLEGEQSMSPTMSD